MRLFITLIASLTFLCACSFGRNSSGNDASTEPDSVVTVLSMPELNLEYELPYPDNTIVAPSENLTEQVAMCVVDTVTDVSVLLLNLSVFPKNYSDAEKVVNIISRQTNTEYAVSTSYKIDECVYMDSCAWRFDINLAFRNATDTIPVVFHGYIFGKNAIITTASGASIYDNDYLETYIKGLRSCEFK